ncbi:asparaginase [Brevibacillus sp. H7]|uniref:asparaginase n=1 Tax=Brevibacillus sp. H7 TaxID=3349138 RepID=UPI0038289466
MGKIVVLTTGGTISSAPNQTNGLLTTGSINGKDLVRLCEIDERIQVDVEEVFRIPSNQFTQNEILCLKQKVESVIQREGVDGVVITHGTDTLEETAYFLDLVMDVAKPIVITGSQRSSAQTGSDAQVNVRQAVQVAASQKSRGMGVLVLFNEEIYTAREAVKIHASNVVGFRALGYGKLGIVDRDDVIYYRKPYDRKTYALSGSLSHVDMIACYQGSDDRFLDCSIKSGVKGIVIEGFGRGHVPPGIVPKVREAVESGIVVVITSRTLEGRVFPVYDFPGGAQDLLNQGVILGGSLSGCKARVKLAVLLSVFGNDRHRIAAEFSE